MEGELPVKFKLLHMMMSVLAPDSPMIAYKTGRIPLIEAMKAGNIAATLKPGDIVLIRTPGRIYKMFREATKQPYDHAVCVVNEGMCVHVSSPVVKKLKFEKFLLPRRQPMIVRVKMTDEERADVVRNLEQLVGREYDLTAVRTAIIKLVSKDPRLYKLADKVSSTCNQCKRKLGVKSVPQRGLTAPASLICTSAILDAIRTASGRFREAIDSEMKNLHFGNGSLDEATMTDFIHLAKHFPQLFDLQEPFPSSKNSDQPTRTIPPILPKLKHLATPVRGALGMATNYALSTVLAARM